MTEEKADLAALDRLTDDQRLAYHKVVTGLNALDDSLPKTLDEENEQGAETVGIVIKRCKKAEKFVTETFREIIEESDGFIKGQRALWKPLSERAKTIGARAQRLVQGLLDAEAKKRQRAEEDARRLVEEKQREQREAEARAMAADTPEEAEKATKEADEKWNETRKAVSALDAAPAQTAVKVGGATVFESQRLDFEILDMGAFATAHPELVEIRRGPTLKGLRDATSGMTELPETLAGWPGLRLHLKKGTSAR